MAITDSEVESLRFHLGYGNIGLGTSTYSPDGFKELFRDVVAAYLTGDSETEATATIAAGKVAAVTPGAMTDIVARARLVVDVGDDAEIVTVKSVTATTFTARFAKAHSGTFPVSLLGGQARLRLLLHTADQAWEAMQNGDIGENAGLKKVDEVEFYQGMWVAKGKLTQYRIIQGQLSSLVRVQIVDSGSGGSASLEAY
jgi:hypothetical protein